MNIELLQLAGRDGDTAYNLGRTLEAIANCKADTHLLVFPETHLMGFVGGEQLANVAEPLDGPTLQTVQQAVRQRNVSVVIGLVECDAGVTTLWNGVRVGLLICYDIELPETARALAQLGAEVIIVTNGNMDPYGPVHRTAIMARAQENQLFSVMVNRAGQGDDGLVFAGGSAVVDPFGRVLYEAGREETRQVVRLDLAQIQAARLDYHYLNDRRLLLQGETVEHLDGRREMLIR